MSDTNSPDPIPLVEPAPSGPAPAENLWLRGLWMLIIAMMISLAQTVLFFATALQFILMLVGGRKPNPQLAYFGKALGDWVAKAARFQTAETEDKPWPWTPLG